MPKRGNPARLRRFTRKERQEREARNPRQQRQLRAWETKHVVGKDEPTPPKRKRSMKGIDWTPTKYGGVRH